MYVCTYFTYECACKHFEIYTYFKSNYMRRNLIEDLQVAIISSCNKA